METLAFFMPLATVLIALVALFTGMGWVFNWLLEPVKENQRDLKAEQKEIKSRMDRIESRMNGIESRMDGIESKLDQLIARQA